MKSTTKKNYLEKKNKTSPLLKTPEKDFHLNKGFTTTHPPSPALWPACSSSILLFIQLLLLFSLLSYFFNVNLFCNEIIFF